MHLRFGAPVFEHDRRAGRLAGLEVDATTGRVTMIIFSHDGRLGSHAKARPLDQVQVHGRRIALVPAAAAAPPPPAAEPRIWSRATRLTRGGREVGYLRSVILDASTGAVREVTGRRRWWPLRVTLAAAGLDLSTPGELAAGPGAVRAA
jgi:hypothetical protein